MNKIVGLVLAFAGVLIVFGGRPNTAKPSMFLGDLLELFAAFFWGATTLYIKRFLAEKVQPIHTFLYQLVFSAPILIVLSLFCQTILDSGNKWSNSILPFLPFRDLGFLQPPCLVSTYSPISSRSTLGIHLLRSDLRRALQHGLSRRRIYLIANLRPPNGLLRNISRELEKIDLLIAKGLANLHLGRRWT